MQILESVRYLHDKDIIHQDLKPSNILVTVDKETEREILKLCDFGSSRAFNKSQLTSATVTMLGTHGYIPPEMYKEKQQKYEISKKSDIWSLGCIIHQVLTNTHPFLTKETRSLDELKKVVISGKYKLHQTLEGTIYENII